MSNKHENLKNFDQISGIKLKFAGGGKGTYLTMTDDTELLSKK